MDLYSMHASAAAVVGALGAVDPEAAREVKRRYLCLDKWVAVCVCVWGGAQHDTAWHSMAHGSGVAAAVVGHHSGGTRSLAPSLPVCVNKWVAWSLFHLLSGA